MTPTYTDVSGLDDLAWSITLTDGSGTPITTGTVKVKLCAFDTASELDAAGVATLTHTTGGVWTGGLDAASVAQALAGLANGELFDVVVQVVGDLERRRARCRKVAVVGEE